MKEKLLFVLILFVMPFASAEVYYEIDIKNEDKQEINNTIQLNCNPEDDDLCPVTNWRFTWNVPQNANIEHIEDSYGEITEYNLQQDLLEIETNQGDQRTNETVRIWLTADTTTTEVSGLKTVELSLPSFESERTFGEISQENLISGSVPHGFEKSFEEEKLLFEGSGPLNLVINHGEPEQQTDYYSFFGQTPSKDVDKAYELAVGNTGIVQDFDSLPVVYIDSEIYDDEFSPWSSGEYSSGRIAMRNDLGDETLPVLAHETVHAFNHQYLEWDSTGSAYIDEGLATYVEFLTRKQQEQPTRELFGESNIFYETENGRTVRYEQPPQGDKEKLWNYYEDDQEFMKEWYPGSSTENRQFGYAYSQLIVRNHISRENGSIDEIYEAIDIDESINDPERKWELIFEEINIEPCNYGSREEFEVCIEEINNYEYDILSGEPDYENEQIQLDEIEMPDRQPEEPPSFTERVEEDETDDNDFLVYVRAFLDYVNLALNDFFT